MALPDTGILITEGCRGECAILTNKNGYLYLQDYGLGPPDLGRGPSPWNWARVTGFRRASRLPEQA